MEGTTEQRDVLAPRIFFDGEVSLERAGAPALAGRGYNISVRGVYVRMGEPIEETTMSRSSQKSRVDTPAQATGAESGWPPDT